MNGLPLSFEYGEETGPEFGTFEAAYELATMDTFVSGVARNTVLDDFDSPDAKKISPEELNSKYPFVEKPFTKPMSEVAAYHLNEEAKKRYALQQAISNGPKGSLYNQAVTLGAGIVAHALDPVEFGVGAFAGMGLSAIGTSVAASAKSYGIVKSAAQAMSGGGTAFGRFGAEAVEGVVGNLALEPFMYNQSNRAMVDYSLDDAFISVIGGGIAAPAAMYGLRKSWGGLMNKSKSATGLAAKLAVGQVQEGLSPNVDLVAKAYDDYTFGNPPDTATIGEVRSNYVFKPLDTNKVNEQVFYIAGNKEDGRVIGDFFGEGLYATDNPNFANNLAANPLEEFAVDVREVKLTDSKVLDGNAPNIELLKAINDSISNTKLKNILENSTTIKEAWQKIRNRVDIDLTDSDAKMFIQAIQQNGFDGISMTDNINGHNSLHIFPEAEAKITETARFSSDKLSIPKLKNEELDATMSNLRSPENMLGADIETLNATKNFILAENEKFVDTNELETDTLQRIQNFEELSERGLIDSESMKEIKTSKERISNIQKLKEVVEDFVNCRGA